MARAGDREAAIAEVQEDRSVVNGIPELRGVRRAADLAREGGERLGVSSRAHAGGLAREGAPVDRPLGLEGRQEPEARPRVQAQGARVVGADDQAGVGLASAVAQRRGEQLAARARILAVRVDDQQREHPQPLADEHLRGAHDPAVALRDEAAVGVGDERLRDPRVPALRRLRGGISKPNAAAPTAATAGRSPAVSARTTALTPPAAPASWPQAASMS